VEPSSAPSAGSIDDVRERLLLWCRRSESGFARVEFTSETARRRVVQGLRTGLTAAGIPLNEITLPTGMEPARLARDMLWRLEKLPPGVVSIDGFASALPDDPAGRADALYRFNLNRERLSRPQQRQIWWMPPHFAEAFVRVVPDLDSWFLVRLRLTEVSALDAGIWQDTVEVARSPAGLDPATARRLAEDYVQRFELGQQQGLPAAELEDKLLLPAITALRQAGLRAEAGALEARFGGSANTVGESEAPVSPPPGETALERADALHRRARRLHDGLQFREAEPLYRQALALAESDTPDSSNIAVFLDDLAQLLQDTNRLAEAEPLKRRALDIAQTSFGDDHPNVATRLNNLAQLLLATNRLAEAEPLMRRALAIDEASFGAHHPNVARDLNNLAQLLQDTNRPAEAEPLMRRALAIDQASFGDDHPKVAIRLNNLAQLLQATNRLDEAEPMMRRALAIDQASFGDDHPKVGIRLNNLAQLLKATHRLDEAEPMMRRALAIDQASFGHDHPNVAIRLSNLAVLLRDTNRPAEAEPLMRRALAIEEASFGTDHPEVATCLNNLAQLLADTHRLAEAEPVMRRALHIFVASLGIDHPNSQAAGGNYLGLLKALGRTEDDIDAELAPLLNRS
jgi:tetratricopeptide (TPR) repeat protein